MEWDNLPPSRCKTEANKFVFNRYKLLELLHGNKLVRTESDNTAAAAASLRPRMVWLAGSGLVVIVIRIHVEQTCEWQPCFSYPIPHSCFRPQRTQANAAFDDDRKELWMLRFQRLQQTQSRAEQNINPSVVQIAIIIDIFQLKREFLGEINDHNEWDGNGKWSQRGFVVGSVPSRRLSIAIGSHRFTPRAWKVIHHIIMRVVPW